MVPPFYVVLLHHPIMNRRGELVTTAVTNMDIHDISRTARTYGAKGYFLVTPIEDQHELVGRILNHWKQEHTQSYHPDRFEAVNLARLAWSFDEVKAKVREETGGEPLVLLTDARPLARAQSYQELRTLRQDPSAEEGQRPWIVVFGTGWGVSETFYPEVHRILAPVYGPKSEKGGLGDYNHLSVRAAAAAVLDRLFGQ